MAIAVLVAYAAARFRVPYTIALVLTGLGISLFHLSLVALAHIELEPELILVTFLPGLLFEAGYHID
jgi:CPA1 family monovalent cation:H+ antiporter